MLLRRTGLCVNFGFSHFCFLLSAFSFQVSAFQLFPVGGPVVRGPRSVVPFLLSAFYFLLFPWSRWVSDLSPSFATPQR